MEAYANALLIAIPLFLILILIEIGYGYWKKKQTYTLLDTVSSISSGMTNILKDTLGLGMVLISYPVLQSFLGVSPIQADWWVWLLAFVFVDFAGYWNHRLSHKINIFWNQHMIHHSSEHFNLACALRQSISNLIGYFPLLLLPAALIGIPYELIAILAPIHLFAQFWYHTEHIGRLGWLEYVIVTPSQHRVHHAINEVYIDKNLGQVFSIWDRIFGTFQEELDADPPQYGVLKQVATWNPFTINFIHFWQILKDAWHTKSWLDKGRIWFMPTGWRPADVKTAFPIKGIEDVYNFKRYEVSGSSVFKGYALFQLIGVALILLLSLAVVGVATQAVLFTLGGYVALSICSYSLFMDQWFASVYTEFTRLLLGVFLLLFAYNTQLIPEFFVSWFWVLLCYFAVSLLVLIYVTFLDSKPTLSL